jgi:multidrug efflux pump
MNISRPFTLRPVATSLIMCAILLAGLVAYRRLPVSALPEVDYPTIQVVTFQPGASSRVIASGVTAPLERQFGQMPGLKQMTSSSSEGASVVALQFDLKLNIDIAEQEVQAAINAAASYLPQDLPSPPIYNKVNPADAPVLTLALTSADLPLAQVQDLADTRLAQKLSQIPGVGLVSVSGGQKPAIRIDLNPARLAAQNLNLDDVRAQVAASTVNRPKGSLDGDLQSDTIAANDQLLTSADYANLVVAYRNGRPVMLSDVANVRDGVENAEQAAWMNRAPAVILNVQRQPGANIIAVVDRIHALLPQLQQTLPGSVRIAVLTDRTNTIRASVKDVQFELVLTVILVVAVIFLFLRNLAATVIPSVVVPLSLVGTFAVMYLAGFTLNNLSLMALAISTGFVVDDAIVMIENIARYIEDGAKPMDAAVEGARQIGFTILSLTVSLIAVLIPLLFMGDIVGRLFREFAITLGVTILISAVVSLTLTPMMCARILRHTPTGQQGRLFRVSEQFFDAMIHAYDRTLQSVFRHETITLIVAAATVAVTIWLYIAVPKGFFPVQDTGVIMGISEAPENISFSAMSERQQRLAEMVLRDPDVENLSSFIGVDGTNTSLNTGRIIIALKPHDLRHAAAPEVARRLERQASQVQGIHLYLQPVQDLTVDDRVGRGQYQLSVETPNASDLGEWTQRLVTGLARYPELRNVSTDYHAGALERQIIIDRNSAVRLGISTQMVDDALYDAFGQRQIATIFTQLNQYRVVLNARSDFQTGSEALANLYIRSNSGARIPLAAFTRLEAGLTPSVIERQGQFPVATISFDPAPDIALSQAVDRAQAAISRMQVPASIDVAFQGTARGFKDSLTSEPILILAALVTVYIVLGVLYESYIHPLTILSTLPSAGIGAILALRLTGTELNMIALIGIILLIGIVKKNAIMMIDFALHAERHDGKPPREAIHQASLLRFRPILMTTLAALLGAVPLALGSGTGSELRRPLGITIIGGLIVSQMLTLYTTPIVYLFFDSLGRRFQGRQGAV